jgi:uncharacterized protein (TIGR03118 family)
MPRIPPALRLVNAACIIALAFTSAVSHADSFLQINLVSDIPSLANNTDPNLKNSWGISNSATSPFWVADQATGLATLYNGAGVPNAALVVTIPGSASPPSGPTGTVFNSAGAGNFLVGGTAASFIFDNLNGTISAWNGGAGTTAQLQVTTPGAIYTGLALANNGSGNFIYAANSAPGGGVNVFNSTWAPTTLAGSFTDPKLPSGLVPFNIQNIGGHLYVTYAALGPGGAALPGGVVDEFDANGNFIQRIAAAGDLFAPWGITLAPANFGVFSNDLLIGNFGNGEILAYDPTTYLFLGLLTGLDGNPIINDNLWALDTRNAAGFNPNAVYFTAGINGQKDGLLGEIVETPEPATIIETGLGLVALAFAKFRRFIPSR